MLILNAPIQRLVHLAAISVAVVAISACSGGGGGNSQPPPTQKLDGSAPNQRLPAPTWQKDVYAEPDAYFGICTVARSGTNPFDNSPYNERWGQSMHEKLFLRSMTHKYYLWADEIVDENPALFSIPSYFDSLKVPQDRFHYSEPVESFVQTYVEGSRSDYGIIWGFDTQADALRISFVEPNSPNHGLIQRGEKLVAINGQRIDQIQNQTQRETFLRNLYQPANNTYTFVLANDENEERETVLTADEIVYSASPVDKTIKLGENTIGYALFNTHNANAEVGLSEIMSRFADAAITDLVLDLRYNNGGRLSVANQLAYMITGTEQTDGKVFERLAFNANYVYTHPFSGESTTINFERNNLRTGDPLPELKLSRVFVLTGDNTCSASESLMNSLLGIGVEVIQIGSPTCGKPFGFLPIYNCGHVYYTTMFRTENAEGFGGYEQGFIPDSSLTAANGSSLPGCFAVEDWQHDLGNTDEVLLAKALAYVAQGQCPPETPASARISADDKQPSTAFKLYQQRPQPIRTPFPDH